MCIPLPPSLPNLSDSSVPLVRESVREDTVTESPGVHDPLRQQDFVESLTTQFSPRPFRDSRNLLPPGAAVDTPHMSTHPTNTPHTPHINTYYTHCTVYTPRTHTHHAHVHTTPHTHHSLHTQQKRTLQTHTTPHTPYT